MAYRELEIETGYILGNGTSTREAAKKFPVRPGEGLSDWKKEYQEREYVGSVRQLPSGENVFTRGPSIIYLPDATAHVRYKIPIEPRPTIKGLSAQFEYQSVQFDPTKEGEKRDAVEWGLGQIGADPKLKIYSPRMGRFRRERVIYFSDGTLKELTEDPKDESDQTKTSPRSADEKNLNGIKFKFDIDKCVITEGQQNPAYRQFEGNEFRPIELEAILNNEDITQLFPVYERLDAAATITQKRFKEVGVTTKPGKPRKSKWIGPKMEEEAKRQLNLHYTEKNRSTSYKPVVVYKCSDNLAVPDGILFAK